MQPFFFVTPTATGQAALAAVRPLADRIVVAAEGQAAARSGLTVVRWQAGFTLEERCARQLAMHYAAMTPTELADLLDTPSAPVTAACIRRVLQRHPAFTRKPGDKYALGRSARLPSAPGKIIQPSPTALPVISAFSATRIRAFPAAAGQS